MSGVTIDTISAARRNHSNLGHRATCVNQLAVFFDVLHGVTNLHRAGLGAQQIGGCFRTAFYVKSIVHRTRRVVFRGVERGEIEPIGFNLGALGNIKTHRTKDGFDALQGERNRVQAALDALATGQTDVECFGFQLPFKFSIGESLTPQIQRDFNCLLGHIDCCTA